METSSIYPTVSPYAEPVRKLRIYTVCSPMSVDVSSFSAGLVCWLVWSVEAAGHHIAQADLKLNFFLHFALEYWDGSMHHHARLVHEFLTSAVLQG